MCRCIYYIYMYISIYLSIYTNIYYYVVNFSDTRQVFLLAQGITDFSHAAICHPIHGSPLCENCFNHIQLDKMDPQHGPCNWGKCYRHL